MLTINLAFGAQWRLRCQRAALERVRPEAREHCAWDYVEFYPSMSGHAKHCSTACLLKDHQFQARLAGRKSPVHVVAGENGGNHEGHGYDPTLDYPVRPYYASRKGATARAAPKPMTEWEFELARRSDYHYDPPSRWEPCADGLWRKR